VLDGSLLRGLKVALNEPRLVGLRPGPSGTLLLVINVLALPEVAPVDPDTRRALVRSGCAGPECCCVRAQQPDVASHQRSRSISILPTRRSEQHSRHHRRGVVGFAEPARRAQLMTRTMIG
jgi:hypothetical protein